MSESSGSTWTRTLRDAMRMLWGKPAPLSVHDTSWFDQSADPETTGTDTPVPRGEISMQDAKRYADRRHLQWIFDRLVNVHHESPNYDYMIRLKEVIDSYDAKDAEVWVPATAIEELKARIQQLTEDNDRMSCELWSKDVALRVLAERINELEDDWK